MYSPNTTSEKYVTPRRSTEVIGSVTDKEEIIFELQNHHEELIELPSEEQTYDRTITDR